MELEGRVCAVTGAARGIGLSLARQLIHSGAKVALLDIDESALASAALSLPPGQTMTVPLDVSRDGQMAAAVDKIVTAWGSLSVWVNNAGLARHRPIADVREEELDLMMAVNFKGTVLGSKHALKEMARRKYGHIVNVISTAGLRGIPGQSVYCASKFAVKGFTEALQEEAAPHNVKVTAVYPGGVDTAFWQSATDQPPPPSILLTPDHVAQGIVSVLKTDDLCMIKELVIRSIKDADTMAELEGKNMV
jgi:NAD(P)-dependent dehydrogenase (short-subunit alcohol dehydrogenase family)